LSGLGMVLALIYVHIEFAVSARVKAYMTL